MTKKILIISIVALLALAIVASFLRFAQNGGGSEVVQKVGNVEITPPTSIAPPTISPAPTSQKEEIAQNEAEIDTSSWKTYTNAEYRFSLRYPEEWKYVENVNKKRIFFSDLNMTNNAGYPIPMETKVMVNVKYSTALDNNNSTANEYWKNILNHQNNNNSEKIISTNVYKKGTKIMLEQEIEDKFVPNGKESLKIKLLNVKIDNSIISMNTHPSAKTYSYEKDDLIFKAMAHSLRLIE